MFLVFAWYRFDSDEIGYRRGLMLNAGVIALTAFALPYYFFRSRGLWRGLLYTATLFSLVAVWNMLQTAGGYAVYYGMQH